MERKDGKTGAHKRDRQPSQAEPSADDKGNLSHDELRSRMPSLDVKGSEFEGQNSNNNRGYGNLMYTTETGNRSRTPTRAVTALVERRVQKVCIRKCSLKLTEFSLKLTECSLKLTECSLKLTECSLKQMKYLKLPPLFGPGDGSQFDGYPLPSSRL
jgi:hypothetical protein